MMNGNHALKKKKIVYKQYLSSKHLRVAPSGAPVAPIDESLGQLNLEREIFARIDSMTMAPHFKKFISSFNSTIQNCAKNCK